MERCTSLLFTLVIFLLLGIIFFVLNTFPPLPCGKLSHNSGKIHIFSKLTRYFHGHFPICTGAICSNLRVRFPGIGCFLAVVGQFLPCPNTALGNATKLCGELTQSIAAILESLPFAPRQEIRVPLERLGLVNPWTMEMRR